LLLNVFVVLIAVPLFRGIVCFVDMGIYK